MEPRYRVVFTGRLVPGTDAGAVIAAFAERFRVSHSTARAVLASGGNRVMKQGLERELAERYLAALNAVGMVAELVPENAGTAPAPESKAPPAGPAARPLPELDRATRPAEANRGPAAASPRPTAPAASVALAGHPANRPLPEQPGELARERQSRAAAPRFGSAETTAGGDRWRVDCGDGQRPQAGLDAPPQASLLPPASEPAPEPSEVVVRPPHRVTAGRGLGWIADAWPLFAAQPVSWVVAVPLAVVLFLLLGQLLIGVPMALLGDSGIFLGLLATFVTWPLFGAGLMLGAHAQREGEGFAVRWLFAGFLGEPRRLLLLGAAYLAMSTVLSLVAIFVAGALFAMGAVASGQPRFGGLDPASYPGFETLLRLPGLVSAVLAPPFAMAVALVAVGGLPAGRAVTQGLLGCWRNVRPLLVLGAAALGLLVAGSLPFLLGLLVVMPLLTIAVYLAFRDIYID